MYFENSFSDESQQQFDFLLKTDPSFVEEIDFQKKVKKAITLNERSALKKKLQSFEPTIAKSFKIWYAAASILLVFGFGFYYLQNASSSENLYDAYYQSYPNVVAPTVRSQNNEDEKSTAFFEYDGGNYEKSLVLFSKIYKTENADYALFYRALSEMELQKTSDAIASFNQFDLSKNNAFTPFVKWYLALAYIKENQKEKAIPLLKTLAETENPQEEMAQKLLKELDYF